MNMYCLIASNQFTKHFFAGDFLCHLYTSSADIPYTTNSTFDF